ncbi:hypothetical protein ACH79_33390 [Bradyrhizobium sp. CCBAU 051011]|uniref:terminase small subunit-like protein n=1 Tax=Bradyrhizobium sp. CCBAU 051011 TaxID=858422 RepID=UPI0013741E0C|nr:hypothetical protein [Bradyrhizobium sp. CCBAU 051011]QHO76800.1 hypothetical protein ACH79_33390 [Bradyrhizobium sp. CCBAU 051011]
MAKPSEYSKEIANQILQRIMDGEMLTGICREEGMPSRLTFYRWMNGREDLKNDYARARLAWADFWAERVIEVSFDDAGDFFIENGKAVADHARVQRARLQTDNIKWLVGKYAPRTYGDKPADDSESKNLTVSWQKIERVIIDPRHGQAPPPAQITYDPGPLPARVDPEILVRLVNMIKERVPRADQRSPDAVLDEVMGVIDRALIAEYGQPADASSANHAEVT